MKSSTGWVTFISDSYKWSSHRYKVSVNSYTNDNSSLTNLKNFQKKKKKWLIANNFLLNITNNEIVHSKSQKTVWLNGKIYIILILWDIWTSKFLSAYLNDGRAVTSKLYTMLKENLLNLCFIPFMNPIFTMFLLFELKNQIRGKHCAYFRQKELRFVFANKKYYQRAIEWIKNYLLTFSLLRISWSVSKFSAIPSYDFVLLGPCFWFQYLNVLSGPYLEFQSNFRSFQSPILGIRDNTWERSNKPTCIRKLPL